MRRFFADPRSFSMALAAVLAALPLVHGQQLVAGEQKSSGVQAVPGIRLPATATAEIPIDGDVADLLFQDLNGDGFLDLAVAANNGGEDAPSYVFLSRAGKFLKPSWTSADESVSGGVALGDLDGDRDPDLVLVRYNHNHAAAYRNKGKGDFEEEPFWESADTEWASGAFVDDFDHDGYADILAKGYSENHRIYLGTKDGPSPEAGWKANGKWAAGASVLADIDRDGRKDLVTTNWIGPAYAVFRGLEKLFEKQPSLVSKHLGEHGGLAVGDLDGDGFPEIAAGSRCHRKGDGRVRLYGNRKGMPASDPVWMSDDVDADVSELVLYDLDRDGDLDLFILSGSHTAAYVNEKGVLGGTPSWRASIEGGQARIVDLNNDGYPDLVVGTRGAIRIFQGGPNIELRKAEPFPEMPKLPALPAKVAASEALGLKLAPLTPELKKHYSLDVAFGVVILAAPADVAWNLEIGNIREGDVIVGVGSLGDYGRHVEPVKSPSELLELLLEYGRENDAHLAGLEWRCGPLHPSSRGEARPERLHLSQDLWSWLAKRSGEPLPTKPELKDLSGTMAVFDAEGKEHVEEDGSFNLVLWSGNSGQHQPVEVKKGQWKAQVPSNVRLEVSKVRLGGRAAYTEIEKLPMPEDGVLAIRAKWFGRTTLRVLDEDSKAELDGLEVVTGLDWDTERNVHPGVYGKNQVIASAARSPIELEAGGKNHESLQTFWVGAPGHAWGQIKIDHRAGGERILVLGRGGDLEVTFINYKAPTKATLRLRKPLDSKSEAAKALVAAILKEEGKAQSEVRPSIVEVLKGAEKLMRSGSLDPELTKTLGELADSAQPLLEMAPAADGRMTIAGLPPGSYDLAVEIGHSWDEPISLGETSADVRAGERTQALLTLRNPPARVPLEGTIALDPGWGRMAFRLTVFGEGVGEREDRGRGYLTIERSRMEPVTGKSGLFRWSAGQVLPGRYRLHVSGLGYEREITVGPSGVRDMKIEIGQPADVLVRVVDAETGNDADIEAISWSLKGEDDLGGSGEDVEKTPNEKRFHFRAPVGEILLSVHDDNYGWVNEKIRVQPGQNEHTLRPERACGFRVTLKDGNTTVPLDWPKQTVEAKQAEGPGEATSWGSDGENFRVTVSTPGLYKVTFTPIEGYEPIPPQEVTVKPKEFCELVVKIVRKK